MKTCNLLVVRANNIRRLEFWFETLEISLIDGIAGKISHICSLDLWDRFRCWRIDILGAEEIRPGFCLSSRIRKSRSHVWNISDVSLSVSIGKLSHISPERQINEETDVYCVWQGKRLFCEFPPWVGLWGFVGEDVRKNMGFEIS